MPTWLKILLISLGVFTVLVVAVVSGGYWWWQQNRDAVMAEARSAGAEGTRFAVGKNQQDCVDEAVTRVKGAGVITGLKAEVFLVACLGAAQPVAAFCDGVPKPEELLKSISWNAQQTLDYRLSSSEGPFVVKPIQHFCASK